MTQTVDAIILLETRDGADWFGFAGLMRSGYDLAHVVITGPHGPGRVVASYDRPLTWGDDATVDDERQQAIRAHVESWKCGPTVPGDGLYLQWHPSLDHCEEECVIDPEDDYPTE